MSDIDEFINHHDSGFGGISQADARADVDLLRNTIAEMRRALVEIAKAEGPYKMDPLEFAKSVIGNMQKVALDILNKYPEAKDE